MARIFNTVNLGMFCACWMPTRSHVFHLWTARNVGRQSDKVSQILTVFWFSSQNSKFPQDVEVCKAAMCSLPSSTRQTKLDRHNEKSSAEIGKENGVHDRIMATKGQKFVKACSSADATAKKGVKMAEISNGQQSK